jgi:hypothetical protein
MEKVAKVIPSEYGVYGTLVTPSPGTRPDLTDAEREAKR